MSAMSLKEFRQFSKLIGKDIAYYITVKTSIEGKKSFGGTSKKMVLARIKQIRGKR
jgi:argininosuccinate lyase